MKATVENCTGMKTIPVVNPATGETQSLHGYQCSFLIDGKLFPSLFVVEADEEAGEVVALVASCRKGSMLCFVPGARERFTGKVRIIPEGALQAVPHEPCPKEWLARIVRPAP